MAASGSMGMQPISLYPRNNWRFMGFMVKGPIKLIKVLHAKPDELKGERLKFLLYQL
jgi:hypothetical protein